ncbi:MAG TPA: lectin-like protein [Verrucomicrobiae bacterium]
MSAFRLSLISILAVAFLFSALNTLIHAAVVHGPIYNPDTGHFYFLLSQNNWTASENESQLLGGHLATINEANEQDWVFRNFGSGFGAGRHLWIGLNDAADEGIYRWSSGDSFEFSAWAAGEPNAALPTEDFVALYNRGHSAQGQWNDWSNLFTDPNGVSFQGVAEVAPDEWNPNLRTITFLDFEDASTMHFMPAPVPPSAFLADQYVQTAGVRFSSGTGPAVAVQLGENHATSGVNGFAGMINGHLNYSAEVHLTFWTPQNTNLAASVDFVALRLDQLGNGTGPVYLRGYNIAGELIAATNIADIGAAVIALEAPGMHRVIFAGNGSAALDDLLIANLTPALPTLRIQREGVQFVRISWPAAFSDWALESTQNLQPPVTWSRVQTTPDAIGAELTIRPPIESPGATFFRLSPL